MVNKILTIGRIKLIAIPTTIALVYFWSHIMSGDRVILQWFLFFFFLVCICKEHFYASYLFVFNFPYVQFAELNLRTFTFGLLLNKK